MQAAERLVLTRTNGGEFERLDVDRTQMCASVACASPKTRSEGERLWHATD